MSEGLTLAKLIAAKKLLDQGDGPMRFTSPYERTLYNWLMRPRDKPLAWYEDQHKSRGFVFATPDFYVMGRPVRKYAPLEQILDVTHRFDPATCDCWYVFLLTGDVRKAWSILPYELPWMCWVRDNDPHDDLRFYETARLMRLSREGGA